MKRFLYLFCSDWRWARALHGGKWVRRRCDGALWVRCGDLLADHLKWENLSLGDYELESYPE